jgi:hypothetical protein
MPEKETESLPDLSIDLDFPDFAEPEHLSQETVDVSGLFADTVSLSGSFDLREFRVSSFGKLLDIIPIPAVLVERSHAIVFANRACKRIADDHTVLVGEPFSSLFPNKSVSGKAHALIDKVFGQRVPLLTEGVLGIEHRRIWGRIHLRSVRIRQERFVLVMIEDITPQKTLLEMSRKADAGTRKRRGASGKSEENGE